MHRLLSIFSGKVRPQIKSIKVFIMEPQNEPSDDRLAREYILKLLRKRIVHEREGYSFHLSEPLS